MCLCSHLVQHAVFHSEAVYLICTLRNRFHCRQSMCLPHFSGFSPVSRFLEAKQLHQVLVEFVGCILRVCDPLRTLRARVVELCRLFVLVSVVVVVRAFACIIVSCFYSFFVQIFHRSNVMDQKVGMVNSMDKLKSSRSVAGKNFTF